MMKKRYSKARRPLVGYAGYTPPAAFLGDGDDASLVLCEEDDLEISSGKGRFPECLEARVTLHPQVWAPEDVMATLHYNQTVFPQVVVYAGAVHGRVPVRAIDVCYDGSAVGYDHPTTRALSMRRIPEKDSAAQELSVLSKKGDKLYVKPFCVLEESVYLREELLSTGEIKRTPPEAYDTPVLFPYGGAWDPLAPASSLAPMMFQLLSDSERAFCSVMTPEQTREILKISEISPMAAAFVPRKPLREENISLAQSIEMGLVKLTLAHGATQKIYTSCAVKETLSPATLIVSFIPYT